MGTVNFSNLFVESTPNWQTYLDLTNDVMPYLQMTTLSQTNTTLLQDVIDAACYWVQDSLGRPFAPTTFGRRFTNFNAIYLTLPYYPILKMISVTEWWGANGPQTLTQQIPENQGAQNCYQLDALRGTLARSFSGLIGRPWFPGLGNLEIAWVAGYNPIPRTVIIATKELIKYWWDNTQQASRSWTPAGQDYDAPGQNPLWPAIPNRVSMLLAGFDQLGMG